MASDTFKNINLKPIKKEETKPVIKIEQQKPINKNVPAPIKKEEPKPEIKINNNPITKNETLPFINEIVKAKKNKEVNNQIILKTFLIIFKMVLKRAQMN